MEKDKKLLEALERMKKLDFEVIILNIAVKLINEAKLIIEGINFILRK